MSVTCISTPFMLFSYLTGYLLENWTVNEAMNTVNIMNLLGHHYTPDTIPYNIMMIISQYSLRNIVNITFFIT